MSAVSRHNRFQERSDILKWQLLGRFLPIMLRKRAIV